MTLPPWQNNEKIEYLNFFILKKQFQTKFQELKRVLKFHYFYLFDICWHDDRSLDLSATNVVWSYTNCFRVLSWSNLYTFVHHTYCTYTLHHTIYLGRLIVTRIYILPIIFLGGCCRPKSTKLKVIFSKGLCFNFAYLKSSLVTKQMNRREVKGKK